MSVVHFSPAAAANAAADSYSVRAQEDLTAGSLILIEDMIHSHHARDILLALESPSRQELKDALCPRTDAATAEDKMYQNMFYFENAKTYALGPLSSKFNHSCDANCAIHHLSAQFYAIWTTRAVKKGQELTLDYVNSASTDFHDRLLKKLNIPCECDSLKKSEKDLKGMRIKVIESIIHRFASLNKESIDRKINDYKSNTNAIIGSKGYSRFGKGEQANVQGASL